MGNPSGIAGPNEFDDKERKTVKGKVVYHRKKHFMDLGDIYRILKQTNMNTLDTIYDLLYDWADKNTDIEYSIKHNTEKLRDISYLACRLWIYGERQNAVWPTWGQIILWGKLLNYNGQFQHNPSWPLDSTQENELQRLKDIIFEMFLAFLSQFFPKWVLDIIRWVYENIEVEPPWADFYEDYLSGVE